MSNLRVYDYINHPYAKVREALLADPKRVLQQATSSGERPELHLQLGNIGVHREIELVVTGTDETNEPLERARTNIHLAWQAANHPSLYPLMRATMMVYALTPTETQLEFAGTYEPPLGVVGEALDAIALHKYAEAAVFELVRELAIYLRRTLSAAA